MGRIGTYCIGLQDRRFLLLEKMEALGSFEMFVPIYKVHHVLSQKIIIFRQ